MNTTALLDRFGRQHRSLRISVTDRCNIRCQYCMSDGPIQFLERTRLLTYEQIATFVSIVAPLGLRRLRLTGGEPLVRSELYKLVKALKQIPDVDEIALTTNGMLLEGQIDALCEAGLDRINISLDTLQEATFQRLSRREGLDQVLRGIEAALQRNMKPRLNALVLRDVNLQEVCDLVQFALSRELTIRFIEFMPLDQDRKWDADRVVPGAELRSLLVQRFGKLEPASKSRAAEPSQDYRFVNGMGTVGFIDPVSQPFCGSCDRLRLTADGKIRNCLFGREEWDIKRWMDCGLQDSELRAKVQDQIQAALHAKHAAHGIADAEFVPPERAMYQIGG